MPLLCAYVKRAYSGWFCACSTSHLRMAILLFFFAFFHSSLNLAPGFPRTVAGDLVGSTRLRAEVAAYPGRAARSHLRRPEQAAGPLLGRLRGIPGGCSLRGGGASFGVVCGAVNGRGCSIAVCCLDPLAVGLQSQPFRNAQGVGWGGGRYRWNGSAGSGRINRVVLTTRKAGRSVQICLGGYGHHLRTMFHAPLLLVQ